MITVIYECSLSFPPFQKANQDLHDLEQTVIQKGRQGKSTVNIVVCSCPGEQKHTASRGTNHPYISNVFKYFFFTFLAH